MSLEPSPEVWVHGLLPLPGARVTEASLLGVLELPQVVTTAAATSDHTVSLQQWTAIAEEGLGMSATQAAAVMRLCFILNQAPDAPQPMPSDAGLRLPLGPLLLLLWAQWAHHELGESCATNVQRAQAASGEVWPSLLLPPAAAAASVLVDGGAQPSARSLAVQTRVHSSSQIVRRRRKLLMSSMPTLLRLVGVGAERLYAPELDRLSLITRPDGPTATRLVSLGQKPNSISAALGCFPSSTGQAPAGTLHPKAAPPSLPRHALLSAMRAALIEVLPPPKQPTPPFSAHKPSSPLAGPPSATSGSTVSTTAPTVAEAASSTLPPSTPITPPPLQPPPPISLPRPTVVTSDSEAREQSGGAVHGTLLSSVEGSSWPGSAILRLQGAKRRTIVLREREVKHGAVQLLDCHGCFIYVLAAVRAVEVLGCCNCTGALGDGLEPWPPCPRGPRSMLTLRLLVWLPLVVIGAASHVISVSHCATLKFLGTTKALRLSNCDDCALHLCVNR
jgi:hypothetical protein